jgi:hypothetical protein
MFLVVPVIGIVAATWRTVLRVASARATPRAAASDPGPVPLEAAGGTDG